MADKPKKQRLSKAAARCAIAIRERLKSLDDAADAAVGAIQAHIGLTKAASAVIQGLLFTAADIAWHLTEATEEDFVGLAHGCFSKIAADHAKCERGVTDDCSPHGRDGLH